MNTSNGVVEPRRTWGYDLPHNVSLGPVPNPNASPRRRGGLGALDPELRNYGLRECEEFREAILRRHLGLSHLLAKIYVSTAKRSGHAAANRELAQIDRMLTMGETGVSADSTDDQLNEFARSQSLRMQRGILALSKQRGPDAAYLWARREMKSTPITFPSPPKAQSSNKDKAAALGRVQCERWWRRKLRKVSARAVEHFLGCYGMVSQRRGAYVSDISLSRARFNKRRNRRTLEQMQAISDTGDIMDLVDLVDGSIANPSNRRCELMVRMRGFEELAEKMGLVGCLLTLTCPSKYHRCLHTGALNPKFNGATPDEAQRYLSKLWARIRAAWHRQGFETFGFRVAEPHHDGTPHWHLLLFFSPADLDPAWGIFREHALREDGEERGAEQHRATLVRIDPDKGSATGYIAKYISKNIDAFGVEHDFEAAIPGREGAERACAWASIWGIRQFQSIGSVSVTVYREFRRVDGSLYGVAPEVLEALRAACDAGDWGRFVELMGGALVRRKDQTVRIVRCPSPTLSPYGEIVMRIWGIALGNLGLQPHRVRTRTKTWKIERKEPRLTTGPPPGGPLDLCQ